MDLHQVVLTRLESLTSFGIQSVPKREDGMSHKESSELAPNAGTEASFSAATGAAR